MYTLQGAARSICQERLDNTASTEEVEFIAELVNMPFYFLHLCKSSLWNRFSEVQMALAQMILKEWSQLSLIGLLQKDNPLPPLCIVNTKLNRASIMNVPVLFSALRELIGLSQGKSACFPTHFWAISLFLMFSNKEKLRTGEMHVHGDQWPYFLYADLAYDPNDPWTSLLQSQLLVTISVLLLNMNSLYSCFR